MDEKEDVFFCSSLGAEVWKQIFFKRNLSFKKIRLVAVELATAYTLPKISTMQC